MDKLTGSTQEPTFENRRLAEVGRNLAASFLSRSRMQGRGGAIRLYRIAKSLKLVVRTRNDSAASEGSLWLNQLPQESLFGDFSAEIDGTSTRLRFTLAHEIAHRLITLYLSPQAQSDLSQASRESLANETASRLLVPDDVVRAFLDECDGHLHLDNLLKLHRRLRVSVSCLLKRISDIQREQKLSIHNVGLVAMADVSRKQRENYAPRIKTRCTPTFLYLPLNSRLESQGLSTLSRLFWQAPLFSRSFAEDTLDVWVRDLGRRGNFSTTVEYIVFSAMKQRRIMLAITGAIPQPAPLDTA